MEDWSNHRAVCTNRRNKEYFQFDFDREKEQFNQTHGDTSGEMRMRMATLTVSEATASRLDSADCVSLNNLLLSRNNPGH